jgi:hypothetical protein
VKVLLINIDSKIPNFALEKIAIYHKAKGDNIIWNMPLMANSSDKIYVSCVFKENKHLAKQYEMYPHAIIGGSGYDLKKRLPGKIEKIKPRINLGFTSRGCTRNCKFCIVPQKEGGIKSTNDLYDIWDGKSKLVTLLDNNILAIPHHFYHICNQSINERVKIDFNQGLDHRLLTIKIIKYLKQTPHIEWRFAYDHPKHRKTVNRAIALLQAFGIKRCSWYVLVGFDTTLKQDLQRLNHLKFLNQNAYVMRYKKDKKYIPIARWANQRHIFQGMTYKQFCKKEGYKED